MTTPTLHYYIRNYQPTDFESYVRLHREAEKKDRTGHCPSPRELRQRLHHPNFTPSKDLFIAEKSGQVFGFIEITPEREIQRAIFHCLVHPDHRGNKLAARLHNAALQRAGKIGAQVVHINIDSKNTLARQVLSRLGYDYTRTFQELQAQTKEAAGISPDNTNTLHYRNLQRGEEALLARLQNKCFRGSWGFNPNTAEDIFYVTRLAGCSVEDVLLAYKGKEPVAYCWTRVEQDRRKGRVLMLGVAPELRQKNIGKNILLAGLNYLQQKGVEIVELTVDSSNIPACRLYYSLGFQVQAESLWYARGINPHARCAGEK